MRLILTGHGETIENKQGFWQGHRQGTLSEEGIKQAEKLALRLKNEKIDAIYSSDLARAADTTKIIAKHHPDVPVFLVKELREKELGSLTGKKKNLTHDFIKLKDDGEPLIEVKKRIKNFLDKVYKNHSSKTVLFVGHGLLNRVLILLIMNKPLQSIQSIERLHNTSICIFDICEDNNHKIHLLNCVKHLK